MKPPIDFYFDFLSPYGYLAATQIDDLAAHYDRDVVWRPFLVGVTVMNIMGMKPLMDTPLKSDYLEIDRPRMAEILGVPLVIPDLTGTNSLAASRAYYWQRETEPGRAKELAKRIFNRLWVEGRDITNAADVAEEGTALGIDGVDLCAAIQDDRVKGLLRDAVDDAVAQKVFGSPYFIVDGEPIWGVDRLWMLEHWLKYGNWSALA